MISDSGFDSGSSPELNSEDPPMSRTHQYRKVMKPLLERKRRARFVLIYNYIFLFAFIVSFVYSSKNRQCLTHQILSKTLSCRCDEIL